MIIRKLNSEDAKIYQANRLSALVECPEAFCSSYEEEVLYSESRIMSRLEISEGQMVLGVFTEDELVGTAGIARCEGKKEQHKCFIWGMYVCPTYRNKGIAKLLLEEAVGCLRGVSGIVQLNLRAIDNNERAINLYKSFGFEEYGREPDSLIVNGERFGEVLMALKLG